MKDYLDLTNIMVEENENAALESQVSDSLMNARTKLKDLLTKVSEGLKNAKSKERTPSKNSASSRSNADIERDAINYLKELDKIMKDVQKLYVSPNLSLTKRVKPSKEVITKIITAYGDSTGDIKGNTKKVSKTKVPFKSSELSQLDDSSYKKVLNQANVLYNEANRLYEHSVKTMDKWKTAGYSGELYLSMLYLESAHYSFQKTILERLVMFC